MVDISKVSNKLNGFFTSLAQYGTNLVPSTSLSMLRGSGNYNPGPNYEQTTYRGPAYDQAYNVYKYQVRNNPEFAGKYYEDDYQKEPNIGPYNGLDIDNTTGKNSGYAVGASYFHPEASGSWNNPDFMGSRGSDRYQIFAINSMKLVPSPLLNFFFCEDNVDHIQKTIVSEVKRLRDIKVSEQSVDELLIIMRNKYLYGLQGFLPLTEESKTEAAPMGTPKGENGSAYWNLPASSGSGMSLEYQISQLNQAVLEECVKQVLSGIDMYKQYYKDASSLPFPLERPVLTSQKGANVLQENIGFQSSHEINNDVASYNQRYNIL